MPTIKILIGDQLVDAEIVMHEGGLYAKVPDQLLTSSMPVLTAKLEAQLEAVSLLLEVGDLVRAAKGSFPDLYTKEGGDARAKMLASDYLTCRGEYESGKFDSAKNGLVRLKRRVKEEMISLELRQMWAKEKKPSPKIQVVTHPPKAKGEKKQETKHSAARFDWPRLRAKLFGADPSIKVGCLLDMSGVVLPAISREEAEILGGESNPRPTCPCSAHTPSASDYTGWAETVYCFDQYGSIAASVEYSSGSIASYEIFTSCTEVTKDRNPCERVKIWYYTHPV